MSVEIADEQILMRANEYGICPKHVANPGVDFKGDPLAQNHADLIALEARITAIRLARVPFYGFTDEIPKPPDPES